MHKVRLLIKKDLIYLCTSLKRLILMSVIFSFVIPIGNITFALGIPMMLAYLLTYGVFAYEEKNKMYLLNGALPVKREEICLSKYLTSLIYIISSVIITMLGVAVSIVIQGSSSWHGSLSFIVGVISLLFTTSFVYHAAILPLLMYFGTIKVKYVVFILYIGVFIIIGILGKEGGMGIQEIQASLEQVLTYTSSLVLIIIGSIVYIISYKISISLYKHKEFK